MLRELYEELQKIDDDLKKLMDRKARLLRQIDNAGSVLVLLFVLIGFYCMIIDEEDRLRYKRKSILAKVYDNLAGHAMLAVRGKEKKNDSMESD